MIYSCFDPQSGQYRYFQDSVSAPVNGDLPVPSYLKSRSTKLGVPSLEAGRPLPRDARRVGSGLTARGMVVECGAGNGQALGDLSHDQRTGLFYGVLLLTGIAIYKLDQPIVGTAVGALGAYGFISNALGTRA